MTDTRAYYAVLLLVFLCGLLIGQSNIYRTFLPKQSHFEPTHARLHYSLWDDGTCCRSEWQ